jgi:hypothetical protein
MSKHTNRWSAADRQAFTDNNLRAQTVPGKRADGPSVDEWDWDAERQAKVDAWLDYLNGHRSAESLAVEYGGVLYLLAEAADLLERYGNPGEWPNREVAQWLARYREGEALR